MIPEGWWRTGRRGLGRTGRLAVLAAVATAAPGLLAGGCGGGGAGAPRGGRVVRVLDGDTVVVAGVGTVRYVGIDTPELHHPRKPVERMARRAMLANAALVRGRAVRLETDREVRDRYGRLLAYVWVDGRMVNAELVRRGLAEDFPFPPNTRHARLFAALEASARRAHRGLWGPGEGGTPWGRP